MEILEEISTPASFAEKVAAFITHNNIDYKTVSQEQILAEYFAAQNRAIDEAARQLRAEHGF